MGKLIKYLADHKLAVLVILLLLGVQAFCDLSLPSYTSDIVDVGIQQSGIKGAAAEKYTAQTYEALKLFMSEDEITYMDECYEMDGELYVRKKLSSKELDKLNDTLLTAAGMVYSVETSGQYSVSQLVDGYRAGLVTKKALSDVAGQVEAAMGDMASSMKSQMAVELVKSEYTLLGYDLNAIQRNYLLITGAKMLAMTLLMVAAAIGVGFIGAKTAAAIGRDLREKLFTKVIGFSNADINKFSTASLITRSTNDVQQVQQVSVMMLRIVLYAPIIGIGGIIKVMGTDTGMGWIIGVAVGAVLSLVLVLMVVAMPKFKRMQSLVDRVNLVSREILTGTMVIRAFSREKHEEERFDKANMELMSTQLFTNRVMSMMMPAMMLIMNAITVLIVWMGAKGIDIGRMQVGDMMAFITYTMQIVMAFLMITMISVMLPRAGVAADRIEEVLNTRETITDKADTENTDRKLTDCKGVVEFRNVSFRFDGGSENAISGLSFKAEPGKTTAIIGSTGCGKSTVVNLLDRFYDVTEGSITLDGVDIRDMSQKELRSHIGLVPQKGVLFSGTIESNIKYGGDFVTDEDMKEAAAIAQATEFIDSKKDGYAESIAQGGTNVSGGQKQRLSIARVFLKNPPILIFDEATSALDNESEKVVQESLETLAANRTTFVIAHRLSTIRNAEKILVLTENGIEESGTHEELLAKHGIYEKLYRVAAG